MAFEALFRPGQLPGHPPPNIIGVGGVGGFVGPVSDGLFQTEPCPPEQAHRC